MDEALERILALLESINKQLDDINLLLDDLKTNDGEKNEVLEAIRERLSEVHIGD